MFCGEMGSKEGKKAASFGPFIVIIMSWGEFDKLDDRPSEQKEKEKVNVEVKVKCNYGLNLL